MHDNMRELILYAPAMQEGDEAFHAKPTEPQDMTKQVRSSFNLAF